MFERSMRGYTDAAHDVALHPASEVLARAYSHAVSACTYKGQDPDAVAYALGYCEHTLMMLKETGRYDRTAVKGS
jgi:hypothetical protein